MQSEISSPIKKTTFVYQIQDDVLSDMQHLVGGEIITNDCDFVRYNSAQAKCHKADLYIKCSTPPYNQKLSFSVSRDSDTCFDGIDRMVLSLNVSSICRDTAEYFPNEVAPSCSGEIIKSIELYKSTIEGQNDKVVYDSHFVIEFESGKKLIFRAEPDGEEVMTLYFTDHIETEKHLRVSDTWFVNATPIFNENNEVIGLKHFYQSETLRRIMIQ